jgi:putative transposase
MGGVMEHPVHHRRSIRLPGYDYSQPGAYFVTLVTKNREELFGHVVNGQMLLNDIGICAASVYKTLPEHFPIRITSWIIMPNHLHGILILPRMGEASVSTISDFIFDVVPDASSRRPIGTTSGSLGAIVQNYKSISTRRINYKRHAPGAQVWQRNYYEHIIRGDEEYHQIADYINNNPQRWAED